MVQPFLGLLSWLAGRLSLLYRLAQPVLRRHFCLMQGPVTSPGKEGMNVSDTALRRESSRPISQILSLRGLENGIGLAVGGGGNDMLLVSENSPGLLAD